MRYSGYQIKAACTRKESGERFTWSFKAERPVRNIQHALTLAFNVMDTFHDPWVRHCSVMLDNYIGARSARRIIRCEEETEKNLYSVTLSMLAKEES